jgi:hypothetical protein
MLRSGRFRSAATLAKAALAAKFVTLVAQDCSSVASVSLLGFKIPGRAAERVQNHAPTRCTNACRAPRRSLGRCRIFFDIRVKTFTLICCRATNCTAAAPTGFRPRREDPDRLQRSGRRTACAIRIRHNRHALRQRRQQDGGGRLARRFVVGLFRRWWSESLDSLAVWWTLSPRVVAYHYRHPSPCRFKTTTGISRGAFTR